MLQVGELVPHFSLLSDRDQTVTSASLLGERYVLFCYPKDDTPGCTTESCAFRDLMPNFQDLAVKVYGVSADKLAAHVKFIKKFGLNFPLLSDPDHQLLEALGVWVEKSMYGKKYFGIQRSTFVINARGNVEQVWEKVVPAGHAEAVLGYLRGDPTPIKATRKSAARLAQLP